MCSNVAPAPLLRGHARPQVLYAARCAGYAVRAEFSSPWLVLRVEPLHGAARRSGRTRVSGRLHRATDVPDPGPLRLHRATRDARRDFDSGITFALFYTCGVTCAKRLLPADRETFAQGLFSAILTGGPGLGAARPAGARLAALQREGTSEHAEGAHWKVRLRRRAVGRRARARQAALLAPPPARIQEDPFANLLLFVVLPGSNPLTAKYHATA